MDLSALLASDMDHLPPFANEYNKQLDREVREQERLVRELASAVESEAARMEVMRAHMRSIAQEAQTSQNLLEARSREAETESHLQVLAEREMGKLSADIETFNVRQNELKDKLNVIQNSIFKTTEKVEEFRQQMNWNKEQLEQWALAEKQKEDDNMSLLKYTKADDVKIKEYTLAIDKLIKEGIRKKAELDAEITETRAAQIQLDKTGEAFKKLHQERQELIRQWEEAIDALKQRDDSIVVLDEEHEKLKREIGGREEILREKQKFLDEQKANNTQLETKIGYADRQLAKVRSQYTTVQASIVEYQDEVETLRNTVGKTATTLETKKAEVIYLKKDILDKKARVERVKQVLQATQSQLKNEFSRTDSLDARAKQLEAYHKQEEQRNKAMDKELAELKQMSFKHSQEMFQLKQKEANLLSEISGSSAASKNLQSKIHKLDSESMKQMELVYNQEYQLQLLERKISRAQGERSNEEKAALAEKIVQLTKELEAAAQTSGLLSSQLKKVEDDVKAARRRTEASEKDKIKLEGKINELVLDNDSAARSLKAVVKTKEEMLIAENFVRIDVKRLRDILYKKADEVYTLGNRKSQLKLAMEERKQDISIHRDSLRDQVRGLETEKHALIKEIKDAEGRVENLKKKYELHLFRYAPQGEEGGEKSQAYYVIRAAQEKEELQQLGDALDAEIAKSEREVRGLVNTLRVLNAQNEKLHSHRSKADLSKEDSELQMKLEQEYEEVSREYESRRRDVAVLQEELNVQNRIANEKAAHCQNLNEEVNENINKKNLLEKELLDQTMKLQRAKQQFIKLGKAFKQSKELPENQPTIFERELLLQERREQINKQLYNIAQIGKGDPEVEFALTKLAAEFSLVLPSSPASFSRQSNRSSGSVTSSSSFSPSFSRPPISTPQPNSSSPSTPQKAARSRPSSSAVRASAGTPPRTPVRSPSPSPSRPTSSSVRAPSPSPASRSPSLRAPSPSPNRPTQYVQPLALDNLSSSLSQPSSPKPTTPNKLSSSSSSKLSSARQRTPTQSPKASPKSSPISRPSSSNNMSISGFEISSRPASSQKA